VEGVMSDSEFIDVAELIAKYDLNHHKAAADAYFKHVRPGHLVLRKPFASTDEARAILPGIGVLLHGLNLPRGAKVLDFGCGTGWMTRALALMGCEAYGVDLAQSGIKLAAELTQADPRASSLPVFFSTFDGLRLPFDDEFFEGVICFATFHHLHNGADILREFHRVMKPGARAGFYEPGPRHSVVPQSQMEMRDHGVIENDIDIQAIERQARSIGFGPATMAVYLPIPLWLTVEDFDALTTERTLPQGLLDRVRRWIKPNLRHDSMVRQRFAESFANLRVFMFEKAGARVLDSRLPHYLRAEIQLNKAERTADGRLRLEVSVRNTGQSLWLASAQRQAGAVNLGVKLFNEVGQLISDELARVPLSSAPVRPGEVLPVALDLDAPRQGSLKLDLVAEDVTWFEQQGGETVTVPLS
jgi:SAM-dependent methyltransferase